MKKSSSVSSVNIREELKHPGDPTQIEFMSFYDKKVAEMVAELFDNLSSYKNLKTLSIGYGVLNETAYQRLLEHLPKLTQLTELTLPASKASDQGIKDYMSQGCAQVKFNPVTDAEQAEQAAQSAQIAQAIKINAAAVTRGLAAALPPRDAMVFCVEGASLLRRDRKPFTTSTYGTCDNQR